VRRRQARQSEAKPPALGNSSTARLRVTSPYNLWPPLGLQGAVIEVAVQRQDFAPFEELPTVLAKPYEDQPAFRHYAAPPEPHERVEQTFCGT
jgi:protein adenylyltransferase